jgi:hypothetical protein
MRYLSVVKVAIQGRALRAMSHFPGAAGIEDVDKKNLKIVAIFDIQRVQRNVCCLKAVISNLLARWHWLCRG